MQKFKNVAGGGATYSLGFEVAQKSYVIASEASQSQSRDSVSIQSRHPELDSGSIHLSRKGKSLREKQTLIDSGSESGMTKNCHAEVAEPQPNRSMQNLNCHPELVSGSSHRDDEGSPLTPTLSRRARGKHAAFTLAEVLITLAIIGVVAAMTIPTLISDYQEKQTVTKLKKAYSILSQAYMYATLEYGSPDSWGLEKEDISSEEYHNIIKTRLFKNVKSIAECSDDRAKCDLVSEYSYIDGTIDNSLSQVLPAFILNDGSSLIVSRGGGSFYRGPNSLSKVYALIFIDVNGAKKPNIYGKDLFAFYLTYKNIMPWGSRDEERNPFTDCHSTGRGCTAWVIENKNMDYLHCDDLSWNGKHKCSD